MSAKLEIFSCQRKSKKKSKKSSSYRKTSLINFNLSSTEVIRPFPGGEMDSTLNPKWTRTENSMAGQRSVIIHLDRVMFSSMTTKMPKVTSNDLE